MNDIVMVDKISSRMNFAHGSRYSPMNRTYVLRAIKCLCHGHHKCVANPHIPSSTDKTVYSTTFMTIDSLMANKSRHIYACGSRNLMKDHVISFQDNTVDNYAICSISLDTA